MSRKCKLSLFTWTYKSGSEQAEVVPICPIHDEGRVRFGTFGTGIIVICEEGTHLVSLCDTEAFQAEIEEATRKLIRNRVSPCSSW